jgi:hypothetical protein
MAVRASWLVNCSVFCPVKLWWWFTFGESVLWRVYPADDWCSSIPSVTGTHYVTWSTNRSQWPARNLAYIPETLFCSLKCLVRVSAGTGTVLTKIVRAFLEALGANSGALPHLNPDVFVFLTRSYPLTSDSALIRDSDSVTVPHRITSVTFRQLSSGYVRHGLLR